MGRNQVVQRLREKSLQLAGEARAANTTKAYASDWRLFETWCREFGRPALPASAETVVLWLAEVGAAWKVATVGRRVAAIGAAHRKAGHGDPTKHEEVREVLRGLRRSAREEPGAKAAVTVAELRRMVGAARRFEPPAAERAAAVLLLGFAGGFRRSELSALDLRDVHIEARGLVAFVGRSKTDQEGRGRYVAVVRAKDRAVCPVRAVEGWIRERGPWPGPLFVRFDARGAVTRDRLSGQGIAKVVKRAAAAAGMDASRYAGHSLRAGLVTAAHEAGRSDTAIMGTTGHRSVQTLARYIRSTDGFRTAVGRGLL